MTTPPPPLILNGEWNAAEYFASLTAANRLTTSEGFTCTQISGPAGLRAILADALGSPDIIAVDDTSEGHTTIYPTPMKEMTKSIFMAMKHAPLDMAAREECYVIQREIFRQFLTVLIQEKTRLRQTGASLDRRITFQEIDRYFAPGYACSHFMLHVTIPIDLRHRPGEWL